MLTEVAELGLEPRACVSKATALPAALNLGAQRHSASARLRPGFAWSSGSSRL